MSTSVAKNHNHYTYRLVILHAQILLKNSQLQTKNSSQSDLRYE